MSYSMCKNYNSGVDAVHFFCTISYMHVIKRDGSREPFDPNKIIKVLKAAGMNEADATKLAQSVTTWLENQDGAELTSLAIRDQVAVQLRSADPDIANLYTWYEKTKE